VIFRDRVEAGRRLAESLRNLEGQDVVVLGIPRGGVEVAAEIARHYGWPLDTVIPRKVRAPGNPELGLGAIAAGVRVLDERMMRSLGVSEDYLEREIAEQEEEIRRRAEAYRGGHPPEPLEGRVAVVVDDGVATGGTAVAALRWARAQGASRVILAVPVAPPEPFFAVGQWYVDFPQTSDREVVALLGDART
jgi:putative phosphoribosyl transferase